MVPSQSHTNHHHHHQTHRFPKYLEVLSDSNSEAFTDEGYEIPLPRKPPRNPNRSIDGGGGEIGLPTPLQLQNRHYWNTSGDNGESRGSVSDRPISLQYRNLLASSTSEDADAEVEPDEDEGNEQTTDSSSKCRIPEHHFHPNLGASSSSSSYNHPLKTHLRGVPCTSVTNYAYSPSSSVATSATTNAPTINNNNYNNHIYAAHSLNGNGNSNSCSSNPRMMDFPVEEEESDDEGMMDGNYASIQLQVSVSSSNPGSSNNDHQNHNPTTNDNNNTNNYISQSRSYHPSYVTSLNSLA
jgi:hypothetical protein